MLNKLLTVGVLVLIAVAFSGCLGLTGHTGGEVSEITNERHSDIQDLNGTIVISGDPEVDTTEINIINKDGDWRALQEFVADNKTVGWILYDDGDISADYIPEHIEENGSDSGGVEASEESKTNATEAEGENGDDFEGGVAEPDIPEEENSTNAAKKLRGIADGIAIVEHAKALRELSEDNSKYTLSYLNASDSIAGRRTYAVGLLQENGSDKELRIDMNNWYPLSYSSGGVSGNTTVSFEKVKFNQGIKDEKLRQPTLDSE